MQVTVQPHWLPSCRARIVRPMSAPFRPTTCSAASTPIGCPKRLNVAMRITGALDAGTMSSGARNRRGRWWRRIGSWPARADDRTIATLRVKHDSDTTSKVPRPGERCRVVDGVRQRRAKRESKFWHPMVVKRRASLAPAADAEVCAIAGANLLGRHRATEP